MRNLLGYRIRCYEQKRTHPGQTPIYPGPSLHQVCCLSLPRSADSIAGRVHEKINLTVRRGKRLSRYRFEPRRCNAQRLALCRTRIAVVALQRSGIFTTGNNSSTQDLVRCSFACHFFSRRRRPFGVGDSLGHSWPTGAVGNGNRPRAGPPAVVNEFALGLRHHASQLVRQGIVGGRASRYVLLLFGEQAHPESNNGAPAVRHGRQTSAKYTSRDPGVPLSDDQMR